MSSISMAAAVVATLAGCGTSLEGLGEVAPDEDADVATTVDTGLSETAPGDTPGPGLDAEPDAAIESDTASPADTRPPPSDTAPPPGDTAPPPSDTAPPPSDTAPPSTDTAPLFDSTPGVVTCGTVACNWLGSPSQCCQSSPTLACTTGAGCPSDHAYLCDERADCVAYGYPASSACCMGVTNNSGCVPAGACGPYPQLCMTNTECASGKCVPTSVGPGKAGTHGQCAS